MNSDVKCSFVYHGKILPVEELVVETMRSAGFRKTNSMPVGTCVNTIYAHDDGARLEHCRVQRNNWGSDKFLGYGTPNTLGEVIRRIEGVYAEVAKKRK